MARAPRSSHRPPAALPVCASALVLALAGCPGGGATGDDGGSLFDTFVGDGDGDGDGDAPGDGDGDAPGDGDGDAPGDGDGDGDHPGDGDGDGDGAALYSMYCASCHGGAGQGTASGPAVAGWDQGLAALVTRINDTMPLGEAALCQGSCAEQVAAYILTLPAVDFDCTEPAYPSRKVRLLTRRELNASLRDFLKPLQPSCDGLADCVATEESCVQGAAGGQCLPDACGTYTIVFDPQGQSYTSVHVAGTFNNWSSTVAGGGWPLSWDAGLGRWIGKFDLVDGSWSYKVVLNEQTWVTDPASPAFEADGFGGQNSVVTFDCQNAPPAAGIDQDFALEVPPESRPHGFAFDNHQGQRASPNHIDGYLAAAERATAFALERYDHLVTCDGNANADACAGQVVSTLGPRAWRRPLTAAESARLKALVLAEDDFQDGVAVLVRVLLSSPGFLYRFELGQPDGGHYRLDNWEIASALAFTLTGAPPDDELRQLAAAGSLADPTVRVAQAERLLASPETKAMLGEFALQWLGTGHVTQVSKNEVFNTFTPAIAQAMADETKRFFTKVALDDAYSYEDLLTANWTVADPALAGFYGLPAPTGDGLVSTASVDRPGIFGQGSFLAVNAYPDQTSPVRRGLFIRQRLLCQDLGTPPANAGAIPELNPDLSTRERFEEHSAGSCYQCHQYIDEPGFAFEYLDPVGRFRADDNGHVIDATGSFKDLEDLGEGSEYFFTTVRELADILAEGERPKGCFTEQVFRYATGELAEGTERCHLVDLQQRFSNEQFRIKALFLELVRHESFVVRGPFAAEGGE